MTDPLNTDRLQLTPLRVEDADEMVTVLAADDLYTFIGGTPPRRTNSATCTAVR